MKLLLPTILLLFGALLAMPVIRVAVVMAGSGASDTAAVSISTGALVQGGIGALLMVLGLVIFVKGLFGKTRST